MSEKRRPKSLLAKLNEPVSWSNIKDVMAHEISFRNQSVENYPDLETAVILNKANSVARDRGIGVEKVLSEWGVNYDGREASIVNEQARNQLIARLGPVQRNKEGSDVTTIFNESNYLREMKEHIGDISTDDLSHYLHRLTPHNRRFLDKLLLGKVLTEEEIVEAMATFEEGKAFWHSLILAGCKLSLLAEALATEPWFPFIHPEKGDFSEGMVERELIGYPQYKAHLSERHQSSLPTDRLLGSLFDDKDKFQEVLAKFFEVKAVSPNRYDLVTGKISEDLLPLLHLFEWVPLLHTDVIIVGGVRPISRFEKRMLQRFNEEARFRLISREEYQRRRDILVVEVSAPQTPWSMANLPAVPQELADLIQDIPAVQLVQQIFEDALEARATDIHLEPQNQGFRVRYRVDGRLQEAKWIKQELADEVVGRIKVLADMDITERRHPQDGHVKASVGGHDLNMRIASVPTFRGERVEVRIVDSSKKLLTLTDLGLEQDSYEKVIKMTTRPYGMVLATGPVGSGKTTSLYSCLSLIDPVVNNVLSIEDPVEYELDGANQLEVNYKVGFGFVEGLRATLRQDPDTILVGEIRDHETAAIAIRASMTGLLVFSSLHTNDAPGAITTFHNFQIPPLLIANSLLGVIAQRLVRKVHPGSMEKYRASESEKQILANVWPGLAEMEESPTLVRAVPTVETNGTGYYGRTGIFEVMEVNTAIRDMILEEAPERAIREEALRNGMRLLRDSALLKVREHVTTMEEITRVVFLD